MMKRTAERYDPTGLCMTCNQAGSCSYLARTEGPIWHCEEFDDSGPVEAGGADVVVPDARVQAARPVPPDREEEPSGLCCNCDNRSTCRLPGAEGGVWFCEEYA
jgi:hypothetical protein